MHFRDLCFFFVEEDTKRPFIGQRWRKNAVDGEKSFISWREFCSIQRARVYYSSLLSKCPFLCLGMYLYTEVRFVYLYYGNYVSLEFGDSSGDTCLLWSIDTYMFLKIRREIYDRK